MSNYIKEYIHINDIYRLVAGHSVYSGDSILSAFTCIAEGKEVKEPIIPLKREQIQNGKSDVLNKIRAEIIKRDKNVKTVRSDYHCYFTAEEVLRIIDTYRTESEEN